MDSSVRRLGCHSMCCSNPYPYHFADPLPQQTEGSKWRQHRKITSPPFSGAVDSTVWKTTILQATCLLTAWTTPTSRARIIIQDIRAVTRNVLSSAGFGVDLPFASGSPVKPLKMDDDAHFGTAVPAGHTLPFGEALDWLLDHVITLLMVPSWLQRRGPISWRTTAAAYVDTRLYISELLSRERAQDSSNAKKNLISALVATSDSAAKHEQLSESDLAGNVFVFAIAGVETTAGTLQYALTQLALRHDLQEWLWTDLDAVLDGESEDPMEWNYNIVWPKLVAPLCIIVRPLSFVSTTKLTWRSTKPSANSQPSSRSQNGPPPRRKSSPTTEPPSRYPPTPPSSSPSAPYTASGNIGVQTQLCSIRRPGTRASRTPAGPQTHCQVWALRRSAICDSPPCRDAISRSRKASASASERTLR